MFKIPQLIPLVLSTMFFAPGENTALESSHVPDRSEIPKEDKWHLKDISCLSIFFARNLIILSRLLPT